MKKAILAIVLSAFVLFLNAPLMAQKSGGTGKGVRAEKVPVKYSSAAAFTDGNGVWIEWETEVESNNLGFYVYRTSGDYT